MKLLEHNLYGRVMKKLVASISLMGLMILFLFLIVLQWETEHRLGVIIRQFVVWIEAVCAFGGDFVDILDPHELPGRGHEAGDAFRGDGDDKILAADADRIILHADRFQPMLLTFFANNENCSGFGTGHKTAFQQHLVHQLTHGLARLPFHEFKEFKRLIGSRHFLYLNKVAG